MNFKCASVATFMVLVFLSGCVTTTYKDQNNMNVKKVATDSQRAENYFKIGISAIQNDELAKAFRSFFKALSYNNKDAKIYDAIAYAYIQRGDNDKAKEFYIKAINHNASSRIYNNYASFLVNIAEYKESIKYSKVASEDPTYDNSYMAYVNLGDAYYSLHNQKLALKAYAKAIKVNKLAKPIIKNRMKGFN